MGRSKWRAVGLEKWTHAPAKRLSRLRPVLIVVAALALMLIAACSGDEATQTSLPGDGQRLSAPTVTVLPPTPTPTPTPTFIPLGLPLPPTATPRPTPTPDPNAPMATPLPTPSLEERLEELGAQLPTPRINHQAFVLNDGRILFAAGQLPVVANNGLIITEPHPLLELYDPESDEWSLMEVFEPPLIFLKLVQLGNGDVLIHGLEQVATQAESISSASFVLDQETLVLTHVPPPVVPRISPDLVLMDDGRVAAIGGIDLLAEGNIFSTPISLAVEIYDSTLDRWVETASQSVGLERNYNFWDESNTTQWVFPMPGARILTFRVGEVEGDDDSFNEDIGRIEIFDDATETWAPLVTLHFGFANLPWHAAYSNTGVLNIMYADRIELFNPSTGEWSISYPPDSVILEDPEREDSFTFERHALPRSATITELPDGRFLVAGGERGGYSTLPRSATILYDPETRIWALGPELAEPRVQHSATVLDDGSVLLFGGATIWEENEHEGAPTNTIEILPAEVLAAVDTVTPLTAHGGMPGGPVDYPCWNLASVPAPLPIVSDDPGELPDARQLLADSLDAMNTAETFALTSLWLNYDGEPGLDIMDTRDSSCSSQSYEFEAADRQTNEDLWFQSRSFNGRSIEVSADQTRYGYSQREEDWRVLGYVEEEEFRRTDVTYTQDSLEDLTITWTTVAIEKLNGVDVYHVHGDRTEDEGEALAVTSYDYWIGVDDYLVRRMYRHDDSPGYLDTKKREQIYALVDIGRFGDLFDIQPPLTPEEAARPEASGAVTCRAIQNLESLPQATTSSGALLNSANDIIRRSAQAMAELVSYTTLDMRYGYAKSKDPTNLVRLGGDCIYHQIEVAKPNQLSSREILFGYGTIESDDFRIVVGQNEYSRETREGDWTEQELDSSQPFIWPHAQFLGPDAIEPEFSLEIEGIESLDGVDVYHIAEQIANGGDETEKTLSMWIGVDDLLLRRISVVTRVEDLEQTLIGGGAVNVIHRLVEFHSFNEDFESQAPPDDEIAE